RRMDRDLRPVSRFAGDALDDHRPVPDLRHLELEEPADEVLMSARDHHPDPRPPALDFGHVGPKTVADAVILARNLVALGHGRLGLFADLADQVRSLEAADHAGDDVALLVGELAENAFAFDFPELLDEELPGCLVRDPAKGRGLDRSFSIEGADVALHPVDL